MADALWRFFISLKLTFVLLSVIALGATLGMSFDQTLSYNEFFEANKDASWLWLWKGLEVYDAFHSWWFSLAILLLSANLIACSIERLPRIWFDVVRPRRYLTKRRRLGLKHLECMTVPNREQAVLRVQAFFGKYASKANLDGDGRFFFYDQHRLARFGVYVVHIALLIVMYSSIYATLNGVDAHVTIEEGQKTRFVEAKGAGGVTYMHDLGFTVGLRDFRLMTFVDNTPMEYESELFIESAAFETISKTIRVNDPLSFAGYTFYQASYQPVISEKAVNLAIEGPNDYQKRLLVKLNAPLKLPNGDELTVERVFDDFAGFGEAIRVKLVPLDKSSTYFHVFRKYPSFDSVIRPGEFTITFLGSDQKFATGLSVGLVPGVSVIFLGFILLIVGIYLCFFVTPQRLFACIEQEDNGFRVYCAAQGFRNLMWVSQDFAQRREKFLQNRI